MWGWPSSRRPQRHKSTVGRDAGRVIRQRRYDCAIERARKRSPSHLGPVEPRNIEVEAQGGCLQKGSIVTGHRGYRCKETATITKCDELAGFCLAKLSVGVWVLWRGVRGLEGDR